MKKLILFIHQLFCHHKYQYTEINHDGLNTMECKWCGKRKIVKVLHLLVLAFVMCGCDVEQLNHNMSSDGIIIKEIDSCEYFMVHISSYSDGGCYLPIHKQNCKFCAERRKKEQEDQEALIRELIRKIQSNE